MSAHEQIVTMINAAIEESNALIGLSPTSLALAVQRQITADPVEQLLKYSSLEHIKNLARKALASRFEPEGNGDESHQGELFNGNLQERYPIPHKRNEPPVYKLLEYLSLDEANWNVEMLRKRADSCVLHADALQAWNDKRRYGNVA